MAGQPKFSFGSKVHGVTLTGSTKSWIQPPSQGFEFLGGTAVYEVPPFETSHSIGLLSLVPGLEQAVAGTVLEQPVRTLNSLVGGVKALVEARLSAAGTFDDRGPSLEWTGLSGTSRLRAGVAAELNCCIVPIASVSVSGGGTGCSYTSR